MFENFEYACVCAPAHKVVTSVHWFVNRKTSILQNRIRMNNLF